MGSGCVWRSLRGILSLLGQVVVWIYIDLKVRREIPIGDKDLGIIGIEMVIKTIAQKEILKKWHFQHLLYITLVLCHWDNIKLKLSY